MVAQVEVAPLSCYSQFADAAAMDAAAAAGGSTPFATWKGAYDYAIANGEMTIDFVPGTYSTSLSGFRSDWGDADGGFVLAAGMIVNGNGAVIDNAPVGSSQICFATLGTNTTVSGFIFKQLSGNPNGGALYVPSSADNWLITGCDFFNCNQGTDAVNIQMGAGLTGTIDASNFYGNNNPNGVYPQSPGLPSSSALEIEGDLTSDLNITNSTFSCNFRNVSGGAIQIHDDVHVDFDGCTFYRNEANASKGGAISIRDNANVTINNTNFIDNFATSSSSADDGALSIQSGSTVTITNSFFKGNTSPDDCGALFVSGGAANITNVTITNTIFEDNFGDDDGGTIEFTNYSNIVMDNCLILNNHADDKGGAIYVRGTSPNTILITNTTITGNENPGEGAVTVNGTNNNVTFDNCVLGNNQNLDIHIEEGSITVNNSNYGSGSGSIIGTGNTTGYTPIFDANYNDASGKGWTGTYSSPVGAGVCPSVPPVPDDCTLALPVELTAFDGQAIECKVKLTWETATEVNNHFFDVQRSSDGRSFESLETIYGAGNSEIAQTYNYTDQIKGTNDIVYYRLMQVDFDGTYAYSNIISIRNSNCNQTEGISDVYPNPFTNEITFDIYGSNSLETGRIELYNVMGILVFSTEVRFENGQNIVVIPAENLASGTYLARFTGSGQKITTFKLFKTK